MDLDTEKLLAKVSGANVENFAECVVSDGVKAKVDFAFNQMFQGLSLLQWMQKITLMDAWNTAANKMIDFMFSLSDKNYITDYLHIAVFDFKKNTLKTVKSSVHANEFFNCPADKIDELKISAQEKIKQGTDIIMNLISEPDKCCSERTQIGERVVNHYKTKEYEQEYERERK